MAKNYKIMIEIPEADLTIVLKWAIVEKKYAIEKMWSVEK